MDNSDNVFEEQLLASLDEKTDWINKNVLYKMQEDYRLHLTCISNLINALVKKSLINADPYKRDKKISDIVCPPDTEFTEQERAMILGTRMSDYESMLDFVCNYLKFTVDNLTLEKIKKLNDLNNTFNWENLNLNSPRQNTRALAGILTSIKNSGDTLTVSLVSDCIQKAVKAVRDINTGLRTLADFQKEVYKGQIRRLILRSPQCERKKAESSPAAMQAEIKRLYPSLIGKKTYYSDLIDELIAEEIGPDKQQLREALLAKLKVQTKVVQKVEIKIDTREILMDAIKLLSAMGEQLQFILEKFSSNYDVMENNSVTTGQKFIQFLRRLFGLKNPPVDYEVIINDNITGMKHKERIHYNDFTDSLKKRINLYATFETKQSSGNAKLATKDDNYVLAFLNKNLSEMNSLFSQLTALDDFFKEAASQENKPKIRGIKMELTTLKNIMIKANQRKAEYASYIEEQEQMKKLGLS